ncbi:ATP-binding protein [Glutamicibacter arilaitensis]|uniref:ATP-binding protein n=1 Tax=Glutamicibacter arilaitensis TaxID=256701 RepID=UPI003FD53B68
MLSDADQMKIKNLRLTAFAQKFFELTGEQANERLTPEEVFMQAVDHAVDTRRGRRIDKLISQAGFPLPTASIAQIHYLPGRKIDEARMRRYLTHEWRADPKNLLIISPTGGGKTYLACAIGVAACYTEHTVFYRRMDDLVRDFRLAREDNREYQRLLIKLRTVDVLIIDDFLTVGIDQQGASELFAVLSDREYTLPTIIVSQTDPEYWVTVIPDRTAGDSIVNRLATNTRWLPLGALDMRKQLGDQARKSKDFWE